MKSPNILDMLAEEESVKTSLEEAQEYVRKNLREGVECPCCAIWSKEYKRSFNRGMAQYLVQIALEFERTGTWVNVPELPIYKSGVQRGDYGYLRTLWGLIEAAPNGGDVAKSSSGLWKPTEVGIEVSLKKQKIWSHARHVRDRFVAFDGIYIHIDEVRGFDYSELMGRGLWWR